MANVAEVIDIYVSGMFGVSCTAPRMAVHAGYVEVTNEQAAAK